MIEAARANDVFLMEAFMYRCHPQTQKLAELVREGAVGRVTDHPGGLQLRRALRSDLSGL